MTFTFVAEKVETIEDFNEAISYGYSYFQGYYFSKPTIMSTKKISENNKVYMHLIKELNEKEFSVDNIEIIIKMDISLSYKLLRLINSAKFGLRCNIKSIRHAILYLGEKEVKKWLYFIAIKAISRNKPEIIAEEALLRAKFAETVFISAGLNRYALNAYLTGMLSLIDTLLDRPLAEILDELFIDDMVKNALIGKELNEYSRLLNLILAYEDADWIKCTKITSEFKISNDDLIKAYMESVEWVNNVNLEQ